jgi:hypothetical protein
VNAVSHQPVNLEEGVLGAPFTRPGTEAIRSIPRVRVVFVAVNDMVVDFGVGGQGLETVEFPLDVVPTFPLFEGSLVLWVGLRCEGTPK